MTLYVKTPLGIDAIEKRTPPLPLRSRQVLIMIDGKRDSALLGQAFPGDALAGILASLIEAGLIAEVAGGSPASSTPAASSPASSPVSAPAGATAGDGDADSQRFEAVRDLMLNSTITFTGSGAHELVVRMRNAASLAELLALRRAWIDAVGRNPMALDALASLERKLDKLLK